MTTMPSFAERVALITGGTQGLGYATASLLKAEGGERPDARRPRCQDKGEAAAAESLSGDGCRAEFVPVDLADPDGPAAVCRRRPVRRSAPCTPP